uniref:Uncharacterized protein n=1 Tax=Anguilla anguilla TaxID=7936 RepID=A0A0E9U3C2_ANGAN
MDLFLFTDDSISKHTFTFVTLIRSEDSGTEDCKTEILVKRLSMKNNLAKSTCMILTHAWY